MEPPAEYMESPLDGEDVAYPCKGCGDVSRDAVVGNWLTRSIDLGRGEGF